MKILILMTIAMTVHADRSVVIDGAVIDVPEWAQTCEHDPLYCPGGWKHDGTFPLAPLRRALIDAWDQCDTAPRVIICKDELVVSPAECTEYGEPVDVIKCDTGQLVVSPTTCEE